MLNWLARTTILHPKVTVIAFGATLVAALVAAGSLAFTNASLNAARAELSACRTVTSTQTLAYEAIAQAAQARAEASERAAAAAREAGRADRAAAERYLGLAVPPPAERCDAASRLVDEALLENRQ